MEDKKTLNDWETWIDEDIPGGTSVMTLRDRSPDPNATFIQPIRKTLPHGPFCIWTINLYGRPPGEGTGRGLDLGNPVPRASRARLAFLCNGPERHAKTQLAELLPAGFTDRQDNLQRATPHAPSPHR